MFEILFNAINESIQSWTKEYGNYIPGFYVVLHTFGSDPLICVRCHIEMEFWFARYGPDKRVLNHFGLEISDRIPIKQFALKSA